MAGACDRVQFMDINCDLGEGDGLAGFNKDAELMKTISRCNIACGGHAGSLLTMRQSIISAIDCCTLIGAHPSYPDREHFGRLSIEISQQQLEKSLKQQIDNLQSIANQFNVQLSHIKFHGALYNDIEEDNKRACDVALFCQKHYPELTLMGIAGGELQAACERLSKAFIAEGFIDRRYSSDARLQSRRHKNSVLEEPELAIKQAVALATAQSITTIHGDSIAPKVDSLCIHGDNPNALIIVRRLREIFPARAK